MGLLAKLFGVEQPRHTTSSYEERLQEEAEHLKQEHDIEPLNEGQATSREEDEQIAAAPAQAADPFRDADGQKIIPVVSIDKVEPHLSNDNSDLEVWLTLHNESAFSLEVTDIEMIRQRTRPGKYLRPGEKAEIRVYRGDTPKTDAYTDLTLRYRLPENGDYFESRQHLEYDLEGEYYVPNDASHTRPVRDI